MMIRILALIAAFAVSSYSAPANVCHENEVGFATNMNNNFGSGLLSLLSETTEGNIFFSPSSLASVLSAIFFGSSGKTSQDLLGLGYLAIQFENVSSINPHLAYCLELLNTFDSRSDEYTLQRANAVLAQKGYPILDEYKAILHQVFGALTKEVDFSGNSQGAVEQVNRWVREKTHGKISKLVDELDESTRLLLLSAIHFKGTWQTEFDPANTKPRPFYNNGNASPKSVPTMKLFAKLPYFYDSEEQYHALRLPYKGNDISMLILLPKERDGIEKLQKTITHETFSDALRSVQETSVTVYLPKFKIEYSKNLKDVLSKAGLGAMFSPDADFSRITGNKDLYVSDIVHKAVVEINEEGSEAAGVSGGIMVPVMLPLFPNEFKVDHPFLFYIMDNRSNSSLFVGRINEL